jgi:hypothetical protein
MNHTEGEDEDIIFGRNWPTCTKKESLSSRMPCTRRSQHTHINGSLLDRIAQINGRQIGGQNMCRARDDSYPGAPHVCDKEYTHAVREFSALAIIKKDTCGTRGFY